MVFTHIWSPDIRTTSRKYLETQFTLMNPSFEPQQLIGRFSLFSQVLMVRFSTLFNTKEQTVTFVSGATYSLEEQRAMGMRQLLGAMLDFSHKMAVLDLNAEELGLFTAVVLVSAGERQFTLSCLLLLHQR